MKPTPEDVPMETPIINEAEKEQTASILPEKKKRNKKKSRKVHKAKGFPKYFKNGYVRYCDKIRPTVCEENPGMDPVEVTKLVATKWFALTSAEKKPFMEEAKLDKERFDRELKAFNETHPEEPVDNQPDKKKKSAVKDISNAEKVVPSQTTSLQKEDDIPRAFIGNNCELPIFTNDFLNHNKMIEAELKQLRKSSIEMDQQNSVLSKHIENMENGVRKVESEVVLKKQQNMQLEVYLTRLKCVLASGLHSLQLPSIKSGASVENIEKYMTELASESTAVSNPASINKANDIIRKMDLKLH